MKLLKDWKDIDSRCAIIEAGSLVILMNPRMQQSPKSSNLSFVLLERLSRNGAGPPKRTHILSPPRAFTENLPRWPFSVIENLWPTDVEAIA